jgi:hypothetical protein
LQPAARLAAATTFVRCGGPNQRDNAYAFVLQWSGVGELFDIDLLDDDHPFEIDDQAAHLFKHPHLGADDVDEVWRSAPLFYPAKPPAHWLMVSEVGGRVLVVPLAPPDSGDPRKCRPIGCYEAAADLATRYREDR